jgi:sugar phosphate isomerase/epimerase
MHRREFGQLAFGAIAGLSLPSYSFAQTKPNSKIKGVQLGAQSYSFRDRSLDEAIKGYVEVGLNCCELWSGHVEPKGLKPEELRKWRLTEPLSTFNAIGQKFKTAGIDLYAYNYSFRESFTDEEIERGFVIAKALGAKNITASAQVGVAKRVDTYAKK